MRILISVETTAFREVAGESDRVCFCDSVTDTQSLLSTLPVDIWICGGDEVDSNLMRQWLGHNALPSRLMLVRDVQNIRRIQDYTDSKTVHIAQWPKQGLKAISFCEQVLRCAEAQHVQTRRLTGIQQTLVNRQGVVILVGAGIMNLINAHYLAVRGYSVQVHDAGPDPRSTQDWTKLGTTHGGGDARMFTRTEADNYNEQGDQIYSSMNTVFRRTVSTGGWSVKPPDGFTSAEMDWVESFESLPGWLARAFKEDIYEINRQAGQLWEDFMQVSPHLFQQVGLHQGITRMYVERDDLEASIKRNTGLGTMLEAFELQEFLKVHTTFGSAAATDQLAGGFTIAGFTLNVHQFVAKLIDDIRAKGVEFHWNHPISNIRRDTLGRVLGLESNEGKLLEADHYVVSPGVLGNKLLEGTFSGSVIQGVLGVWLQIPNLEPKLSNSIKLHRRGHVMEDINITVATDPHTGEDILVFGGGYGFVGLDRPAADNPELQLLFSELETVARTYFPQGYDLAKQNGSLWTGGEQKFCIRPFTPTGLGVFETVPTVSGGRLIITGGNNTGGFAQAPAIARAVHRAFTGEHDPIHVLFHPKRGRHNEVSSHVRAISQPRLLNRIDSSRPLRLLLLCSDGPEHAYLRYRLDKVAPFFRCIVETHAGQISHLKRKGRNVDAWYMWYHTMRRQALGLTRQRQAYFAGLMPSGYTSPQPDLAVESLNCKEVWQAVDNWQPDLTIVSGTKYIGKKLNERGGLMINLHMGSLPDYKGNHCVFFALYDGAVDKVAATLHLLTSQLDGGAVLDRVAPPILPSDTEETLYTRCLHMAIDRCVEHVSRLSSGEEVEFFPQSQDGKMFRHCDRTLWKEIVVWSKLRFGGLLRDRGTS
jgi:glycine/D-amino acid oxidase-like deaminating enzyme/folate-dependent phosphoribosylglycinamide formyltransferase PurN